MNDAVVGNLRPAIGQKLSIEALLVAEWHVIAGTISKVGFWRRKIQPVPTPPPHPPWN